LSAIGYYITLPLIYAISFLPFWMLYGLSDFVFLFIFHVFGYRRKVVMSNLQNAFPDKSNKELKIIERKFYRYFCDLILETVKSLTISRSALQKRLSFASVELFEKYFSQKQSIVIAMGHFGNWELGGARFAIEPLHQLFVIYHPLKDKNFDGLVYKMRTRLGNGLYAMKDTLRGMIRDRDKITATAFIADQTPSPKGAHWMQFMNQDTPVFIGTGKIAKKMNYPVVYVSIRRKDRGYYEITLEDLVADPSMVSAEEIVERFTQRLETDIREMPEYWLWTHKRWKHKRPNA
jgi:KDO2-lipid IV(A) lauroyltransferase